ncbi:hypothetical protein PYW07_001297 [Mythimna separata]|uniref:Peptidase S1 domain-containing protein n=1 Tax=Mythimna separata TaxID=271217 RepID=A0AAD7YTK4_MYTSE|nr:hypothetical protein PYW07_001297 [Mythimna separata]
MQSERLSLRKAVRIIEVRFLGIMCLISCVQCQLEPFVAGGNFAAISNFPHAAFMSFHCYGDDQIMIQWICGASILNQELTLTAGHCLSGCNRNSTIIVSVGSSNRNQGVEVTVHSFFMHPDYNEVLSSNDIGLVRLNTMIHFNENVKRVMLMQNPPYFEKAQVAGWGLINEIEQISTNQLKYAEQIVMSGEDCQKYLPNPPKGTICGDSRNESDYSTQ